MEKDESRERVFKARVARERAAAGNRRVRFSKALRQEAVELLATSGARRCEFAKEMGLSSTSLQRWELLFQVRGQDAHQPGAFQRVTIASSPAAADVELIFPSGARLVGLSWQQVRELLGVSA